MFFLREWYYNVKNFIHRGRHGWAPTDVWDIDDYLSSIIPPMVRIIAKKGTGCPQEFYDEKLVNNECAPWHSVLEEIAQGFEAAREIKNLGHFFKFKKDKEGKNYTKEYQREKGEQLTKKMDRGLMLFTKYYLNLWD